MRDEPVRVRGRGAVRRRGLRRAPGCRGCRSSSSRSSSTPRHLLYSASLAPRLRDVPFAPARRRWPTSSPTRRSRWPPRTSSGSGGSTSPGYWIAAVLGVFIPWNLATLAGVLLGGAIPDPARFGLDVVFPAAMAGLAVGPRRPAGASSSPRARARRSASCSSLAIGPGDRDRRRRPARAAGRRWRCPTAGGSVAGRVGPDRPGGRPRRGDGRARRARRRAGRRTGAAR